MKSVALTFLFAFGVTALSAQSFTNAVGLRFGFPWSVSGKHFLDRSNAIEAYVGARSYGLFDGGTASVSAAYLRHESFGLDDELAPLQWYYGGGASVRFWNYNRDLRVRNNYNRATIGVSGYLGLQYAFEGVPIELTLDWVPTVHLGRTFVNVFGASHGGLGARYILGR